LSDTRRGRRPRPVIVVLDFRGPEGGGSTAEWLNQAAAECEAAISVGEPDLARAILEEVLPSNAITDALERHSDLLEWYHAVHLMFLSAGLNDDPDIADVYWQAEDLLADCKHHDTKAPLTTSALAMLGEIMVRLLRFRPESAPSTERVKEIINELTETGARRADLGALALKCVGLQEALRQILEREEAPPS